MRILSYIDTRTIREPLVIAAVARGFLRATVLANRALMQRSDIPPLYESGVVFGREPWHGRGLEEFATCDKVLARGWGDCDDLCPWRVAELQEAGEPARLRIYWRFSRRTGNVRLYHVQVRRADGRIEDPSRDLGMHPPTNRRKRPWRQSAKAYYSLAA